MSSQASSVGRNSLIMASGTFVSRITGQLRTILLAAAVGTTGIAANAYQTGTMIPQVLFTILSGGVFNAVLVPQIVKSLKEKMQTSGSTSLLPCLSSSFSELPLSWRLGRTLSRLYT